MQATVLAAENEICARSWKLSALFCIAEHPNIYDSSMQLLPDCVRGLLLKRFQHMRNKDNTMKGVNLLSFIIPRTVQNRHELPVLVILHGSHVLGLSTVEALLNSHWRHCNVYAVGFRTGQRLCRCFDASHLYRLSTFEFETQRPGIPGCGCEFVDAG